MSLLQDVLRTQTLDSLDKALAASPAFDADSDDELIGVVCRFLYPSEIPVSHQNFRYHSRGHPHSLALLPGRHHGRHRVRRPLPGRRIAEISKVSTVYR